MNLDSRNAFSINCIVCQTGYNYTPSAGHVNQSYQTQETINGARLPISDDEVIPRNIHTDPEFARDGLFAGTVNAGITTMAYINQMLEQSFPASALYNSGRLLFKAIEPFRPGDSVIFTGSITAKREEGGKKIVECEIKGTNQHGKLIGVAEATVVLDE